MKVKKAHCLFEQSGTFKNEFIKLGIPAIDYDIRNDYGQTDVIIDLFDEIEKSYGGGQSIFDNIECDDLIISFFPCTRFETKMCLLMRCDAYEQSKYTPKKKLEYSMKIGREQGENYQLWCKMFWIAHDRGFKMIVENPASKPNYLTTYFCEKAKFIDKNRRERGDYMYKPTQYWFVGCEPNNNLILEPIDYVEVRRHETMKKRETRRSELHPQYANRFIREFILDEVSS